jgi:CBS domain-containing protein
MATVIRDVMTPNPRTVDAETTVKEAAKLMRDHDIGAVVVGGDQLRGIVTDRDIVVRAIAAGKSPRTAKLGDICSDDLVTVTPDDPVDDAVRLMRERALRRVLVAENGRPVGIVSMGDLAVDRDRESVLADVSAAPPNR